MPRPERSSQIGNWLISILAWGPLLLWAIWPLFDDRLAWHPLIGYSSIAALTLNLAYTGHLGINDKQLTAFIATIVAYNVSFVVAAHPSDVGKFVAASIVGGTVVSSFISGLVVVEAVRVSHVQEYGIVEDAILLTAPLVEGAMIAGVTSGALASDSSPALITLVASLLAGATVSIFVLAWVYLTVGFVSSWLAKHTTRPDRVWWPNGY